MNFMKFITAAWTGYLLCSLMVRLDGHNPSIFPLILFPIVVLLTVLVWSKKWPPS